MRGRAASCCGAAWVINTVVTQPSRTAISGPGIQRRLFTRRISGEPHSQSTSRPPAATAIALREKVALPFTISTSPVSSALPSATGICCIISRMPIAASMPLMTLAGTSEIKRPARRMPNSNCSTPASTSAIRKREKEPRDSMAATTMVTSPAAGPLTAKREGLRAVTTRPPMMPVSRPTKGGKPLAWAMPRHSGRATRKTTMPARES